MEYMIYQSTGYTYKSMSTYWKITLMRMYDKELEHTIRGGVLRFQDIDSGEHDPLSFSGYIRIN